VLEMDRSSSSVRPPALKMPPFAVYYCYLPHFSIPPGVGRASKRIWTVVARVYG
jgi:hypothetical protein